MNKFVKIISMTIAAGILLICPAAKAMESAASVKNVSCESLRNSVWSSLHRFAASPGASFALRNQGRQMSEHEVKVWLCQELCQTRINWLRNILKNEIFLPVDVDSYLRSGFVATGSDEGQMLKNVVGTLRDRAHWAPKIEELISGYVLIKSEFGGGNSGH